MADVSVPSIATATPDGDDTVLGVKDGIVKRFSLDNVGAGINFSAVNATTNMVFNTNGTEKMRLDSAGNVGIGTATPDRVGGVASVNNILDVNGSITLPYSVTGAEPLRIGIFSATNFSSGSASVGDSAGLTVSNWNVAGDGSTIIQAGVDAGDGGIILQARRSNTGVVSNIADFGITKTTFSTNNTERMRLDSAGNLGIGTSSPALKLSVLSGVNTNNTTTPTVMIASDRNDYYASINSVRGSASTYLGLSFSTSNNAAPAERMRIDPAGNLGIGTSSPAEKLDVFGSARFQNTIANNDTNTSFVFRNTNSTGFDIAKLDVLTGSTIYDGLFSFKTRDAGGTLAERMRLDSSGNLIQTVNTTAATLGTNNTLTFSIVDNSTLRISVRGSDGTTRTGTVALT